MVEEITPEPTLSLSSKTYMVYLDSENTIEVEYKFCALIDPESGHHSFIQDETIYHVQCTDHPVCNDDTCWLDPIEFDVQAVGLYRIK